MKKIKISTILAYLFYPTIFVATFVLDILYLTHIKISMQKIVELVILAFVNLIVIKCLIEYIYCWFSYFYHIQKVRNYNQSSQARGGVPGSGKSSSMCNDAVIMADMAWRQICYDYFLIQRHIWKPKTSTRSAEWDKRAICECYHFYKDHPQYIPCLYSKKENVIFDNKGRHSQIVTLDHLQGKRKLLYRAVIAYDEIGKDLPAMTKFIDDQNKDVNLKDVADFMRYLRHYGNFKIIYTEQDVNNMYIGNRRVTGENIYFVEQKTILRPVIFDKIKYLNVLLVSKIQSRHDNKLTKTLSVLLSKYLIGFDNFCSYLGFRKFKYLSGGNTQKNLVKDSKGSFILLPHLNCYYDDRSGKFDYDSANNDYFVDNEELNENFIDDKKTVVEFCQSKN